MPFTFSHPAIVLPLTYLPKRFYSLTGLIIGSLTPDFEYFIRMKVQSDYSHTLAGLLWFDLPLSFLLAIIYHNLMRDCLINNLPNVLKSRLSVYKTFDWNNALKNRFFIILISLLIGSASHLLWDSFTHRTGFIVQTFPSLISEINIGTIHIPIFKILQHLSSIIGGLAIIIAFWKLPLNKFTTNNNNFKFWIITFCITVLIFLIRFSNGIDYKLFGNLIVTFISALILALFSTTLILRNK